MKIQLAEKIKWHKIGLWDSLLFSDYLIVDSLINAKKFGFDNFKTVLYLKGEVFISADDFKNFHDLHKKSYEKTGIKYFESLGQSIFKNGKKAVDYSVKIKNLDFTKCSDEKLLKFFEKFLSVVQPNIILGYIIQPIDLLFEEILKQRIAKYIENKNPIARNQIITRLTPPKKETLMVNERRDFLKISREIDHIKDLDYFLKLKPGQAKLLLEEKYPRLYKKLIKHEERYSWMSNFNWNADKLTIIDYIVNLKEVLNGDPAKELEKLKLDDKNREGEYNAILKELRKNKIYIKDLTDTIRDFVSLKMENWEAVAIPGNNCLSLFNAIAGRFGISLKIFFSLPHIEIIRKLKHKNDRIKKYYDNKKGVLGVKNDVYLLSEKDINAIRNILESNILISDLYGLVVYPGVVSGTVSKIILAKESAKMKDKNVLVCPMTNPDYMPIIRKAIAIITDEGGLLCHAAIVAREFKIPCIVGTKIATKVLKDGDLVEVDANRGIVNIIKRAK